MKEATSLPPHATALNDPSVQLVRSLLTATPEFVSGEKLAEEIQMSRVAIWKRLQRLSEEGFELEGVRSKGYRLTSEPQTLSAPSLLSHLSPESSLHHLSVEKLTRSTNADASEHLAKGYPTPFACSSLQQQNGRGRLGRPWYGYSKRNLYLSLGFNPQCPHKKLQLLSIWSGLRLCRRLRAETNLPVQLKWPNDLWIQGRKIAGILSEATFDADRMTALVFGIGLNIASQAEDFPPELADIATSLSLSARGKIFSFNRIAAAVTEEILFAYQDCLDGVDEDVLSDLWQEYACFLNEPVQLLSADGASLKGILSGIDRSGALLLRGTNGTLHAYRSGDLSLRKMLKC